jgi:hypothetical protein
LEIFYVGTNNRLYHNRQTASNSLTWTGETEFTTETNAGTGVLEVAVGQNADGRLEIFYAGTNHEIYHNWQMTAG